MARAQSDAELRQLLADFRLLGRADRAAILALLPDAVRSRVEQALNGAVNTVGDDRQASGLRADLAPFLAERIGGSGSWQMTGEALEMLKRCATTVAPGAPAAVASPSLFDRFARRGTAS